MADRPGIDYGCIVAGVPQPREQFKAAELFDPEYVALRGFFSLGSGKFRSGSGEGQTSSNCRRQPAPP